MKQSELRASIIQYFDTLQDPRLDRTKRHKLIDIIAIAICAVVSGAEGFTDMQEYGHAKQQWLGSFLELPNGIPSHDTFGRFFSLLNPHDFHRCFSAWISAIAELTNGRVVAIDGKALRRSYDSASNKAALHMVSAWTASNRLVLAQQAVDGKSNEITAIPELIDMLDLNGAIVTIDAMGCQRDIATKLREAGADYVLALKENHPTLHQQTVDLFEGDLFEGELFEHSLASPARFSAGQIYEHTDAGHGRIEVRRCWAIDVAERWAVVAEWSGLRSVAMIERQRHLGESISIERSYYLTSLPSEAKGIAEAVPTHWSIENALHWCLDVSFAEDFSRVRVNNAAENFALLRKIALNLLSQHTSSKSSTKAKRKRAGWDNDFLRSVLAR